MNDQSNTGLPFRQPEPHKLEDAELAQGLPGGEGLPPSLLADLMGQIRCDKVAFEGFDSGRQETWLYQPIPARAGAVVKDLEPVHWQFYWHNRSCSYPDRTGDVRSIVYGSEAPEPQMGRA